jgi:hypothetical protein
VSHVGIILTWGRRLWGVEDVDIEVSPRGGNINGDRKGRMIGARCCDKEH